MVEVVVGTTIIAVGLLSLVGVYNYYLRIMIHNTPNIQATYLLEESIEIVRLLRDQSWSSSIVTLAKATSTKYYLVFNTTTSKWSVTPTATALIGGQFERYIIASSTSRNATHNIVPNGTSGATLDASTTLITAKVSWLDGSATTTKTLSTYLTNIFAN